MASIVETPQIIIGVDSLISSNGSMRSGIFRDLELMRTHHNKGSKRASHDTISSWYESNKDAIFLSTLGDPNIISFTHKFNSDSPADQGLFVVEVLDPANIFEHRFLEYFYNRTYGEGVTDANVWMTTQEETMFNEWNPGKSLSVDSGPPWARKVTQSFQNANAEVEFLAKRPDSRLSELAAIREAMPFTKSIMVTFGAGNDARNWAPVQKCSLVAMDYELTKEGLKKLTIKFVPNPGLLRYNDAEATTEYLMAGAKTNIQIEQPIIVVSRDKKELIIKNPSQVVLDIISRSFENITESPVILLLDNLKKYLDTKFKQAVVTAVNQFLPPSKELNLTKSINEYANSQYQSASPAQKGYLKGPLAKVKQLLPDQTGDFLASMRMDLVQKLSSNIGNNMWDVGMTRDFTGQGLLVANVGSIAQGSIGTETAPSNAQLQRLIADPTPKPGKDVTSRNLAMKQAGWGIGRVPQGFWNDTLHGFGRYLQAQGGEDVAGYTRADMERNPEKYMFMPRDFEQSAWMNVPGNKDFQIWIAKNAKYSMDFETPGQTMQRLFGTKKINTVTSVVITKMQIYSLYLQAIHIFFTGLGMRVVKSTGLAPPTVPIAGNITGEKGGMETQELMMSKIKPISIHLSAKGAQEMKEIIQKILVSLGAKVKLDPYVSCFSEIGLVDRCKKYVADSQRQDIMKKYAHLADADSLFLVTSYAVMDSLLGGDELDPDDHTHNNDIYPYLKRAFGEFKGSEPPIDMLSDYASFGKLFQNPSPDATLLSTHNPLTLMTGSDGKTFKNNEALNRYLEKNRIPVFNYGLENSNVLSFNFNLKPWYAYLLTLIPQTLTDSLQLRGVAALDITKDILKFYDPQTGPDQLRKDIEEWYDGASSEEAIANNPKNYMAISVIAGTAGRVANPDSHIRRGSIRSGYHGFSLDPTTPDGISPPPFDSLQTIDDPDHGPWSIPPHAYMDSKGWDKSHGDRPPTWASPKTQSNLANRKSIFVDNMVKFIQTILNKPFACTALLVSPANQSEITDELLTIRSKLSNRTFTGKLTTVPLFSLMSVAKTLGSRSLLYFLEPEAMASNDYKEGGARNTWLSGEYYIVGYEIVMTPTKVTTTFNVLRNAHTS